MIRMVMLFQKMIRNSPIRKLFESYLQDEIYNDEESKFMGSWTLTESGVATPAMLNMLRIVE